MALVSVAVPYSSVPQMKSVLHPRRRVNLNREHKCNRELCTRVCVNFYCIALMLGIGYGFL